MSRRKMLARTEEEYYTIYAAELEKEHEKEEKRKHRAITKRRVMARLCKPAPCVGSTNPESPCKNWAVPGGNLCSEHGGNVVKFQSGAQIRLLNMVPGALKALEWSLGSPDPAIALKAAQMVLDRTGFHGKALVEVEQKEPDDLRRVSDQMLVLRAKRQIAALEEATRSTEYIEAVTLPPPPDDEGSVH